MTTREEKWDYEAILTETGTWYGKRCPAIAFNVKKGQKYRIEWCNCRTVNKYIYDMRKCGGMYVIYGNRDDYTTTSSASGSIDITIPGDGTLFVGVGNNNNVPHGEFSPACFDGDYIRVRLTN